MKPFEIYIAYVSWVSGGKSRPVLALLSDGDKISAYPITSRYAGKSETVRAKYFKINGWSQLGLDRQSYVDTGTLISFPAAVIDGKKPIGEMSAEDKRRLLDFLTKQM
jgi:hypothetical protein